MLESEVNERLERAFPAIKARFDRVTALPVEGMDAFVGELTLIVSDPEGGTSRHTHSGAYAQADGLRFPAFTLQPQSMLLGLVSGMLGVEAVHIEREPRFSSAYHLAGVHAQKTRALFSDSVVAWFAGHPGLRLESAGRGLLLYGVEQNAGAAPERFARDAAEIFRRLADSQRNAPPGAPQDPRAAAAALPGFIGRHVRRELVTRAEADAFLAQPVPRKLPANIERYYERRAPLLMFGVGLIFTMGGAGFAYGFGSAGDWKGVVFGGFFAALGAPLAVYFARKRYLIRRLLERGELASATIEHLEDSGFYTSSTGAVWRLNLRYLAHGQSHHAQCSISGFGIHRARDALDARKPVRILYDVARPQRVLFVDDLITASPEYDS